jgi:hypothetical protein
MYKGYVVSYLCPLSHTPPRAGHPGTIHSLRDRGQHPGDTGRGAGAADAAAMVPPGGGGRVGGGGGVEGAQVGVPVCVYGWWVGGYRSREGGGRRHGCMHAWVGRGEVRRKGGMDTSGEACKG